jgi:hypothetical protein
MSDFTETQKRRRGHLFLPPRDVLNRIPEYYDTEHTIADHKVIWIHYFSGGCDWYLAELDRVDWIGYGAADIGHGPEWGPFSLPELERVRADGRIVTLGMAPQMHRVPGLLIVERDCHWTPRTWGEIEIEKRRNI